VRHAFEGFTWPERFHCLHHALRLRDEPRYCPRSYFADPAPWCNCFKVSADGPPGLWRTVFPTDASQPEADVTSDVAVQALMQKFSPQPSPTRSCIATSMSRSACCRDLRLGRVLLAGDAAHVNNPIGGMGLMAAFRMRPIFARSSSRSCSTARRSGARSLQSATAHSRDRVRAGAVDRHKKRLEASDPEVRRRNFDELRQMAADRERARAFLLRTAMIASQRRAAGLVPPI